MSDFHEMNDKPKLSQAIEQQQQSHNNQHQTASVASHAALNDRLRPEYIDVDDQDSSLPATLTRIVTGCVSHLVTPRQLLGFLRVLKAITFCFLILTIFADLMYMVFLEILASEGVRDMAGGTRDTVIRIYGLVLSFVALAIEVDIKVVVKQFLGLKGFIPRGALMFFIAIITGSHPIMSSEYSSSSSSEQQEGDDDFAYSFNRQQSNDMPSSAIGFQMVTSVILGCCALCYVTCGIFCCDRFTRKAFLSDLDPRVTTSIAYPERE